MCRDGRSVGVAWVRGGYLLQQLVGKRLYGAHVLVVHFHVGVQVVQLAQQRRAVLVVAPHVIGLHLGTGVHGLSK